MKLLLYCTKANKYERLVRDEHYGKPFYLCGAITENFESLNGKIVAECDYEVEEIFTQERGDYNCSSPDYFTKTLSADELADKSCLTYDDIDDYLDFENGYAIHIKNLHIFDESKELSEYYSQGQVDWIEETELYRLKNGITTAPQNMRYAYKYSYSKGKLEKYILISIRPEWLCKILNREKTIEVRRKVLKEMLK